MYVTLICFNLQDEITTVIMPDVSIDIVSKFLKLVYTGSTGVANNDEMNEINHFGAKILVSFYKHLNNNLRAIYTERFKGSVDLINTQQTPKIRTLDISVHKKCFVALNSNFSLFQRCSHNFQ